ncbi:Cytosolic sorting protein GGA2/TOM1 [Ceraceosorus bombacis]|uniref:Cytosolic sorting protein GGA2/TOM1 n=1 Tax=Ceraceosorus bombacis TaxID=401625 RepID=A0A0N7LAL1_9BASI|nr:Cytosolic sorting protein GGA2/TOM1 [Ceraceosorus bombacis]
MYNHQQRALGSGSGSGSGSSSGGYGGGYGSAPPPRGAWSSSSHGNRGSGSAASTAAAQIGAWADWAAKSLEERITPVGEMIERACSLHNRQPNLALNLEIADYIKSKKANTPRDAAIEVVARINSRHPHVAMLGLHLLDNLVKNCGYAFHLQISTKEFLNELVKRFPERPPMFLSPQQSKVLELIHEWKNTICVSSKHKEDLVHIRDMHRLLGYKGYRFPQLDSRAASVMNPEGTLRSPEELEEEDREAQAAKLQELIRRGTPRDLEQAQELMVIMSGAQPESKPDYKSQTGKELDKVQSRAILLNDMLDNATPGEKFVKGDAYDQIAHHLRSVQPRLQKWIGEAEEEESEHMDRLLLINDLINQICDRHQAFARGDREAKVTIDASIDPRKGGADAAAAQSRAPPPSFGDWGALQLPVSSTSSTAAAGPNGAMALPKSGQAALTPSKPGIGAPAPPNATSASTKPADPFADLDSLFGK